MPNYTPTRFISAILATALGCTMVARADSSAMTLRYPFWSPNPIGWTQSMNPNDDGSSVAIPLGFTFDFYGQPYDTVWINNNGNLTFDGPYGQYTSTGFPFNGPRMIAPFWADADTRNRIGADTNLVWHKFVDESGDGVADTLVVTWDAVGYFANHNTPTNTFQVAISSIRNAFGNPTQGSSGGMNVLMSYGDMGWTTGDASGGTGGFGGTPATVGVHGGGGLFWQFGRFDQPGYFPTGVDRLDHTYFAIDAGNPASPPSISLVSVTPVNCGQSDGAIDITVTDAEAVSWTGPLGFTSTLIDSVGLIAGQYTVNAIGPGGSTTFAVSVPAAQDHDPPTITGSPATVALSASGTACTALMPDLTSMVSASDGCTLSEAIVKQQTIATGTPLAIGSHPFSFVVVDSSGNASTVGATITVEGSPTSYFRDVDLDGYGWGGSSIQSCSPPHGYVADNTDCNDTNAAVHPGATEVCDGIDADCDGIAETDYNQDGTFDCGPLLEMVAMSHAVRVGDTLVVRIHQHASPAPVNAVQLVMHFDQTRLRLDDIALAAGAPYQGLAKSVDNPTGRAWCFAYTLASGVTAAVDVAVLTFTVTAPTSECLATSLLRFEPDGASRTSCAVDGGTVLVPPTSDLAAIAIDSIAPVIVSYFASASAVASADCTATVPDLASSVVATDNCTIASITQSPAAGTSIGLGSHPITLIVRDVAGNSTAVYPDFIVTGSPASYYADADLDGYGAGAATISCAAIAGKVTNNTDCNDANNAVHPGATEVCNGIDDDCIGGADNGLAFIDYYTDADHDGYGAIGASAQSACAQPTDSAPNNTDCNDANAGVHPGAIEVCGDSLDNNCSGAVDEGCAPFTVILSGSASAFAPGDPFVVRAMCTAPTSEMSGAQLTLHFDPTRLRLDAVDPVAPAGLNLEIVEQINNTAGTLRYALGMSEPSDPLSGAADLCDLTFTVLPGADLCGAANLVTFGDVGAFTTRFTRFDNAAPVVPALTNLPPVNLDSTPPVLTGVPAADIAVATDAGSTFGALVSLPTVTAVDACEGDVAVTVTGAIASGLYPIGTTTVTWSATDSVGNTVTVSRDIVVGDYQLLDARISLTNRQLGASNHAFRIAVGSTVQVIDAVMPAWAGSVPSVATVAGIQVPVSAGYDCATAKSVAVPAGGSPQRWSHTITDAAPVSIAGARYSASFSLVPGDSNDDDMVEILDYGNFVVDRSSLANPSSAAEARSNYDGDNLVVNSDFGVFSAYFFRVGESCTPPLHAPQPRARVSVKELRRMGRGDLAAADINRDGWLDTRDMQLYLQGGGAGAAGPTLEAEAGAPGW